MSAQTKKRNSSTSLLIAGVIILFTTHASAEWQPLVPSNHLMNWQGAPLPFNTNNYNNNSSNGVPWSNPTVMPITWGDCIPVPVEPLQMGIAPMQFGHAVPFNGPTPIMNQPITLPAPTPFYGGIPSPLPLPPIPAAPVCNDNSDQIAQARKEIEAANKKNSELKHALNDTQNQLQDSVALAKKNTQTQSTDRNNIQALKSKIAQLNQTSTDMMSLKEHENTALKQQLAKTTANSGKQAQQLLSFNRSTNELNALKKQLADLTTKNNNLEAKLALLLKQSSMELGTLKRAHQEKNLKNEALKKQLVDFRIANQTLQAQLAAKKTESANQGKQMMALKQSSTQLASLQLALQGKDKNNEALRKQLADDKNTYLALQARLAAMKTDAATQGKQILGLKQSSTQLSALRLAQQEKDKENEALKKQLADGKNAYQALQAQLAAMKTDAATQGKQILALKQSSTQLTSLKISQLEKDKENDAIKMQLGELSSTKNTLQAQVAALKTEAATKSREILGLKQASSQLRLLQQAYKGEQDKALNTKAALDSCKKNNEDLNAELADLKNKSGSQAQKITSLMSTAGQFDKLKNAYKDLASKKEALNAKLSSATADSDKDGILDSVDKCPSTTTGLEVDALGCFADTDKDGIANSADQCPTSPANSKVNNKGCSEVLDADKDGIADANDLCPTSKEGDKVNDFGCAATEDITLKGVNFKLGSAKLTPSSFPTLDAAAETIKKNPNLKIEIAGHTDNQGVSVKNQRLSQVRANSVMIYLIRKGVAAQNLTAKGYGEEQPVATNDTKKGMATNRRVELKISK